VQAHAGETIWQLAQRCGIAIPHLCHSEGLRPDGNCRACVVEVAGERTLAASCCRTVASGMDIHTDSPRAQRSQKMVLELLQADCTPSAQGNLGELSDWAAQLGVAVRPHLQAPSRPAIAVDDSHPAMRVQLDACIQCGRCVRACREEQVNNVIGMAGRGAETRIVFDLGDDMGASSCVACGECVQACPTGALAVRPPVGQTQVQVDKEVDSVCPFCGVGCLLTYQVQAADAVRGTPERIVAVQGRDGPANGGRLCVKGRFGFDYIHHPERLTRPLIRREGVAKDPAHLLNPPPVDSVFREATWEEALDWAARGLRDTRSAHGPHALAGFGSAKGSNEEAYLFQKLIRTAFGTHNVDHCTRLCHASSVAALLEGVGSGAVSNPVSDVEHAELIVVIGSNPTSNHPVAATWMKNAVQRGAKLVLADPRRTDLARHAWRMLPFKADTDVILINALLHVVFEEGLVDAEFIAQRVADAEAVRAAVQDFAPEAVADRCGIAAETLREVARAYATSRASMILWGMGVSQHTHGTDNVRALIALATVTGQIGRVGTGLHPLRGQNNVQGASDAGLIPFMLPNYQRVSDPHIRTWFEDFWQAPLSTQAGLTVVDILNHACLPQDDPQRIRAMYVMGENPAMSDPDLNHSRHALASLDHLVVQDIFLTETAWLADVVLPASAWPEKWGTVSNTDRMVQLGRPAVAPPGEARADVWIIQQLAARLGRADGQPLGWTYDHACADGSTPLYHGVAAIYDEMRQAMHSAIGGITWARLLREGSVTYPCVSEDDPGQPVVFTERFPTADGRVHLRPTTFIPAQEQTDADFPFVLITGRQLEHWHTGSMTRRAEVLDALEPAPTVSLHPDDLAELGVQAGDTVHVASRRGQISLTARADAGTPRHTAFIPFAYAEAAANLLTNAALDPWGKIPEFKYCAVRVVRMMQRTGAEPA
jgi:formate dehydrogenase major subunit